MSRSAHDPAEAPRQAQHGWQGVRVLVTGGAGFIGSHLVDALLGAGAQVRVLDNLSTGRDSNLVASGERIEFTHGDVRDTSVIRGAIGEDDWAVEVIFHLAALGSVPRSFDAPLECHEVNAGGTSNLIEYASQVAAKRRASGIGAPLRFVLASSSSIYGGTTGEHASAEDLAPAPLSPYAESKVAAEACVRSAHSVGEFETSVLRLFNVYGPRQDPASSYAAVVPRFFDRCRLGQQLEIYGDGEQRRDFTFVSDVVRAFMLAGAHPRGGVLANIGNGNPSSVNQLAALVIAACATGDGDLGERLPLHHPGRAGEPRYSHADIRRARGELGWLPQVSLAEGIRRIAATWGPLGEGRPANVPDDHEHDHDHDHGGHDHHHGEGGAHSGDGRGHQRSAS